jgi:hypothetical protein
LTVSRGDRVDGDVRGAGAAPRRSRPWRAGVFRSAARLSPTALVDPVSPMDGPCVETEESRLWLAAARRHQVIAERARSVTVVASLLIEGIPAIIGDFLITDNDTKKPHIFVPTRPDINSSAFKQLDRRVAGMVRKVHIFNDNFVAGFTGPVEAGKEIFSSLEHHFSETAPTLLELGDAFERFNNLPSASVAGWTMRSKPRCFLWSATPGARAEKVPLAIIGSGANHFTGLLTGAAGGYSDSVTSAWDKAVLSGLAKIGALVAEELLSGSNLVASYGYGGELIILTSRGFRAVDKLTLLFWNVRIEDDGTINYLPANVSAVYENRGRFTIVQISNLNFADGRLTARDTHVMAITPIHEPLDDLDVTTIGRLDLSAPYYFVEFRIFDVKSGKSGVVRMTALHGEGSPIRHGKRNGLDYFEMDRDAIEPLIADRFKHEI